jgi:hypothetical protein
MRLLIFALSLCAAACGTVCDSAAGAQRRANDKGRDCSHQNITVNDANKCNSGLSKCSPDDVKELQAYADCLDALPVCSSSNSTSWAFSRAGCQLQPIGRISGECAGAIF